MYFESLNIKLLAECTTTAGDKCDFPFTLNGVEHTKCTLADSTDGKPWCSIGNLVEFDARSMIKGICDLNACEGMKQLLLQLHFTIINHS